MPTHAKVAKPKATTKNKPKGCPKLNDVHPGCPGRDKLHLKRTPELNGVTVVLQCEAHDHLARAFAEIKQRFGLHPKVISSYRTCAEQKKLYDACRDGTGSCPAAKPGESYHNQARAVDIGGASVPPRFKTKVDRVMKEHGFFDGTAFADPYHYQYKAPT